MNEPVYPLEQSSLWGKRFAQHADDLQYMVEQLGYSCESDEERRLSLNRAIAEIRDVTKRRQNDAQEMRGVHHPSEEHYKMLARVCEAADAPCEQFEMGDGAHPFCGTCLSCRAGAALIVLQRLANEHMAKGT